MKKKAAYGRSIRWTGTFAAGRAGWQIRHDLIERAIPIIADNRSGNPLVKTSVADNDTPELNALKALFGAPISMGRGENPVELLPAAACLSFLFQTPRIRKSTSTVLQS
ncbi:hypothetical protein [Flintibacter sp.]|uniref:hypothetical protein n=1 Tax=Flintibacter sp. TaxID=1918624 RepID=UPI003D0B91A2|nr:hypothetical protein [Flintibacter sp.]